MVSVSQNKCDECGTCIGVCPSDALLLDDRLRVNEHRCTGCGVCVEICPFGALQLQ